MWLAFNNWSHISHNSYAKNYSIVQVIGPEVYQYFLYVQHLFITILTRIDSIGFDFKVVVFPLKNPYRFRNKDLLSYWGEKKFYIQASAHRILSFIKVCPMGHSLYWSFPFYENALAIKNRW